MSYKNQVLKLLESKKFVKCYELVRITHRFGSCIFQLRKEGYKIYTHRKVVKSWFTGKYKTHTKYELRSKYGI